MSDHPRLRAWDLCPLCGKEKERGIVAHWACFNTRDIIESEQIFDRAENALLTAARKLASVIEHRMGPTRPMIYRGVRTGLVNGRRTTYPIVDLRSDEWSES